MGNVSEGHVWMAGFSPFDILLTLLENRHSSLDPIVASPSGIDSTDYLQFMSTSQLLQIDLTCWCKRVQPVLRFWSCRASLKRLNVDGNFGLLALPTL